jgi:hypothetical protein
MLKRAAAPGSPSGCGRRRSPDGREGARAGHPTGRGQDLHGHAHRRHRRPPFTRRARSSTPTSRSPLALDERGFVNFEGRPASPHGRAAMQQAAAQRLRPRTRRPERRRPRRRRRDASWKPTRPRREDASPVPLVGRDRPLHPHRTTATVPLRGSSQDTTPILERNKAMRTHNDGYSKPIARCGASPPSPTSSA